MTHLYQQLKGIVQNLSSKLDSTLPYSELEGIIDEFVAAFPTLAASDEANSFYNDLIALLNHASDVKCIGKQQYNNLGERVVRAYSESSINVSEFEVVQDALKMFYARKTLLTSDKKDFYTALSLADLLNIHTTCTSMLKYLASDEIVKILVTRLIGTHVYYITNKADAVVNEMMSSIDFLNSLHRLTPEQYEQLKFLALQASSEFDSILLSIVDSSDHDEHIDAQHSNVFGG